MTRPGPRPQAGTPKRWEKPAKTTALALQQGHSWCDLDGPEASRLQGWWTVTPWCQQRGLPAQGLGVVTF